MRLRLIIIAIICLKGLVGSSQSTKFLNSIDSTLQPNSYLYNETDEWQVFLADARLDQQVDLLDLDEELLCAAVFHFMNKYRKRYRREPLLYSENLDVLAQNYTSSYTSYSFENTDKNRRKLNKTAQFAARSLGFRPRLVDVAVSKQKLLNYTGRPFFYHRKDTETELHLFYGNKEQLKDTSFIPEPIKTHTYRSLAKNIVSDNLKNSNGQLARSRAYSYMACHLVLEDRSLYKNKIPQANMVIVYGGFRTKDYKMRRKEAMATSEE